MFVHPSSSFFLVLFHVLRGLRMRYLLFFFSLSFRLVIANECQTVNVYNLNRHLLSHSLTTNSRSTWKWVQSLERKTRPTRFSLYITDVWEIEKSKVGKGDTFISVKITLRGWKLSDKLRTLRTFRFSSKPFREKQMKFLLFQYFFFFLNSIPNYPGFTPDRHPLKACRYMKKISFISGSVIN